MRQANVVAPHGGELNVAGAKPPVSVEDGQLRSVAPAEKFLELALGADFADTIRPQVVAFKQCRELVGVDASDIARHVSDGGTFRVMAGELRLDRNTGQLIEALDDGRDGGGIQIARHDDGIPGGTRGLDLIDPIEKSRIVEQRCEARHAVPDRIAVETEAGHPHFVQGPIERKRGAVVGEQLAARRFNRQGAEEIVFRKLEVLGPLPDRNGIEADPEDQEDGGDEEPEKQEPPRHEGRLGARRRTGGLERRGLRGGKERHRGTSGGGGRFHYQVDWQGLQSLMPAGAAKTSGGLFAGSKRADGFARPLEEIGVAGQDGSGHLIVGCQTDAVTGLERSGPVRLEILLRRRRDSEVETLPESDGEEDALRIDGVAAEHDFGAEFGQARKALHDSPGIGFVIVRFIVHGRLPGAGFRSLRSSRTHCNRGHD
jgi:hypothetical protein